MPAVSEETSTIQRPQGQSERWDEALIALLALVSLADTADIARVWDKLAPPQYRGLLLAEPIEDIRRFEEPRPPLWWDINAQRYGVGLRGFIVYTAIVAALEAVKAKAAALQANAVAAVYAGQVLIGDWQATLAAEIKQLALMAAALARGGVGNLVADDLHFVGESLKFHYERLERFARQIERGAVENPEAAQRRAGAYALSVITGTYDATRVRSHMAVGFDQEQNILDLHADHCAPDPRRPGIPDCPGLTELGWVKIGTLPVPGTRRCLFMCKCRLGFRRQ